MNHKCPVCYKIIKTPAHKQSEQAKTFPFCSQRCKLIDLGAWLDAKYKIVSEPPSQELSEIHMSSSKNPSDKL